MKFIAVSQQLKNQCSVEATFFKPIAYNNNKNGTFFVFFIVDLSPLCLLLNGKQYRVSQRLPNVRLTLDGRFIAVSPYRWMALRVSVVVTGFGLGKCCCCGAVLLQLFSQFQFSRQLSSILLVLCHQGSFKKATSYGELLSEFYLFDAKSYFAEVEKN